MNTDGEQPPISASQIDRKPELAAELGGQKEFQPQSTAATAASPHCNGVKEELHRAETQPPIVCDSDHQVTIATENRNLEVKKKIKIDFFLFPLFRFFFFFFFWFVFVCLFWFCDYASSSSSSSRVLWIEFLESLWHFELGFGNDFSFSANLKLLATNQAAHALETFHLFFFFFFPS